MMAVQLFLSTLGLSVLIGGSINLSCSEIFHVHSHEPLAMWCGKQKGEYLVR